MLSLATYGRFDGMTGALDDAVKVSLGLSRGDGVSCVSFAVSCAASLLLQLSCMQNDLVKE